MLVAHRVAKTVARWQVSVVVDRTLLESLATGEITPCNQSVFKTFIVLQQFRVERFIFYFDKYFKQNIPPR